MNSETMLLKQNKNISSNRKQGQILLAIEKNNFPAPKLKKIPCMNSTDKKK